MAAKKKIDAPANRQELDDWTRKLRDRQRQIDEIAARHRAAVHALAKVHSDELAPLKQEAEKLWDGIASFLNANRATLCAPGEKFVDTTFARFSWKWTGKWVLTIPKAIMELFDGPARELLKVVPPRFVRRSLEPNRQRMAEEVDAAVEIPGVTAAQNEFLYVAFTGDEFKGLGEVEGPKSGTQKKGSK